MVAHERLRGLAAQLALLVGVAEAAAPPAGVEQAEELVERPALAPSLRRLVVALEDLVDEDPEALVDRRLARDPEDARELVLQRARPVGLDVRGAQQQPVAARGRNGSSDGSARGGLRGRAAAVALGVEQRVVERRRSRRISRCSGVSRLQQARVDVRQRVGDRSARRGARAARELDQLEVAHDGVRDVEVGVEAQLAEAPADLRDRRQQLVAQRRNVDVQRLRRPEQLLLARPPTNRRPRPAPPRRTATAAAPRRGPSAPGRRARARRARASSRRAASRRISARVRRAVQSGGTASLISSVRDRLEQPAPRARHARAHQAEDEDVVELVARGGVASPARARRARRSASAASSSRSPASATAAIERANSRAVACGARRT